jgi:ankyrin repeat protein
MYASLASGLQYGRCIMRNDAWSAVVVVLLLVSTSYPYSSALAGPIHDAAKLGDAEQVERLITAGAGVDEKDIADKTALFWAAGAGQMDVVQLLVAKGANVNAKDFYGLTVVGAAALAGQEAIVELLIGKGADVNSMDSGGVTPLDDASRKGYAGIIELLKRHGAKCGTSVYSC